MARSLNGTMKPEKTVSKTRNRAESTQKLLQAALEVFSEMGFDAATTKAISQRAGLNESLIQRYFQSKAGLFNALVHLYAQRTLSLSYPPGRDLEEEIFNFLKARYEQDTQSPDFVRVGFHRVMSDPPFAKAMGDKYRVPDPLLMRLKTLQKNGCIKAGVHAAALAQIITNQSFLVGIIDYAILGLRDQDDNLKRLKFFARYIAQGVAGKRA